ncbi:MAG: hybrid sensor histidine kinase/response regulator [Bacteroidales bacterium]|jgi:signal transduction histidine kinase|nr:hybrid sensor histidine kinase/response regulator [Bacteroidales bacterium]
MNKEEGKILIVDDNYENLQVLGIHLQEIGYDIEFATSGKAALDWLENDEFDLVLLDINMPGMNGFEVCNKIRTNTKLNNLPIIFLSAENQRESILKGLTIGGQDYVTKPFDSRELSVRVKTHIDLKKSIYALEALNQTLEKKIEERTRQLKIAKEKAEESDRMKHAFLNNFSHEIRTPLVGIVSTAEIIIQSEQLSDDDKKFCLTSIKESSNRLLDTIGNVLEMSQLLSGSITADFKNTAPQKIVQTIHKEYADMFKNKNLSLNIETGGTIDEITTDPVILKKILVQLVSNALKFTENGHVTIGIKPLAGQVEIFVSDTGLGMDDKTIDNLFNAFFQRDPSNKRVTEGAGLGLTIVHSLCRLLKGEINVTSTPGQGTCIRIILPAQQPE